MKFELQNISGGYEKTSVLENISLEINHGEFVSILGPNGCGKSTLLKIAGRLQKPFSGNVLLDGMNIKGIPGKELAKRIAILPQSAEIPAGITVEELISFGRYPYRESASARKKHVLEAMEDETQE
jgi:iron complex transport system ATP-binding protein